ncbi:MAG: peptidoglycan editing factor PgeF [Deltaproteobacteria bacterium]|jgi:YfiH family protein|nr:peptidoglycan editing factor PgeF [Deltaproteobacteria bacterium]MBW2534507.1 peptidoglycan editing factor PgeF [Deltaproteobacteria bacterium]
MSLGLRSDLLRREGFAHAFFTRRGGVSRPPYDQLNFSTGTGDDPAAVRANWELAADHLGVSAARIYVLKQVHGRSHRTLRGDEAQEELMRTPGDITVSRAADVACAVRTADCPAILLADRRSGAVAACHSGWRGTVRNVAQAGLDALREVAGGSADVIAAIGPHIEDCCFEVGDDVAAELAAASPIGEAVVDRSRPRAHVDLRRIIEAQLRQAGLAPDAIDHVRGCTHCDPARFHSYRRNGKLGGRLMAAIVVRGRSH